MKGWIWALWLSCFVMVSHAQDNKVVNDPNAETRIVDKFDGIEVSGAIELIVSQAPEFAVAISANDPDDIDKIVTEVRGGVLHIRYKEGKNWWNDQWNTMGRKFRAYVSAPDFRTISMSGSGSIKILDNLKADDLSLSVSGSGNIEGKLDVSSLKVVQSGSGNIRLSGTIEQADVRCSGSGNFRSESLVIDVCNISMSGSGNADLTVNKEMSARVSGSGNIRYRGTGLIRDVQVSGSGKIRRVDNPNSATL